MSSKLDDAGPLSWSRVGWDYKLAPEGHMWRFSGSHKFIDHEGKEQLVQSDFGLLPGGAYVAIRELLDTEGAADG